MVFNSAFFLFIFLPVTFLLFLVLPWKKGKDILLCAASLVFYAFGGLAQLPVLLFAAVWDWAFGVWMQRTQTRRKLLCGIGIAGNLLLLCFYKYTTFLLASFGWTDVIRWSVPLGISFFTFHGISYLADTCRAPESGAARFGKLLLYLAFFPRLLAGPIVRYHEAAEELDTHSLAAEDVSAGLRRFVRGLCKKLLISETVAAVVDAVFGAEVLTLGAGTAWLGAIAYCLQLYFDFSGYSDMAIGLGRLFGFHFPENFNYPYVSGTVSEFWRRWHITLNLWFKEYLYIPLGGSRCGKLRATLNRLTVFLCTGIWHGAGWTYILWGLWHGVLVSAEGLLGKERLAKVRRHALGSILTHVCTLLAVVLGFVMFRASTAVQGFGVLGRMFSFAPGSFSAGVTPAEWTALGAGIVFSLPVVPVLRRKLALGEKTVEITGNVLAVLVLIVCILALAAGNFHPFIYQQF